MFLYSLSTILILFLVNITNCKEEETEQPNNFYIQFHQPSLLLHPRDVKIIRIHELIKPSTDKIAKSIKCDQSALDKLKTVTSRLYEREIKNNRPNYLLSLKLITPVKETFKELFEMACRVHFDGGYEIVFFRFHIKSTPDLDSTLYSFPFEDFNNVYSTIEGVNKILPFNSLNIFGNRINLRIEEPPCSKIKPRPDTCPRITIDRPFSFGSSLVFKVESTTGSFIFAMGENILIGYNDSSQDYQTGQLVKIYRGSELGNLEFLKPIAGKGFEKVHLRKIFNFGQDIGIKDDPSIYLIIADDNSSNSVFYLFYGEEMQMIETSAVDEIYSSCVLRNHDSLSKRLMCIKGEEAAVIYAVYAYPFFMKEIERYNIEKLNSFLSEGGYELLDSSYSILQFEYCKMLNNRIFVLVQSKTKIKTTALSLDAEKKEGSILFKTVTKEMDDITNICIFNQTYIFLRDKGTAGYELFGSQDSDEYLFYTDEIKGKINWNFCIYEYSNWVIIAEEEFSDYSSMLRIYLINGMSGTNALGRLYQEFELRTGNVISADWKLMDNFKIKIILLFSEKYATNNQKVSTIEIDMRYPRLYIEGKKASETKFKFFVNEKDKIGTELTVDIRPQPQTKIKLPKQITYMELPASFNLETLIDITGPVRSFYLQKETLNAGWIRPRLAMINSHEMVHNGEQQETGVVAAYLRGLFILARPFSLSIYKSDSNNNFQPKLMGLFHTRIGIPNFAGVFITESTKKIWVWIIGYLTEGQNVNSLEMFEITKPDETKDTEEFSILNDENWGVIPYKVEIEISGTIRKIKMRPDSTSRVLVAFGILLENSIMILTIEPRKSIVNTSLPSKSYRIISQIYGKDYFQVEGIDILSVPGVPCSQTGKVFDYIIIVLGNTDMTVSVLSLSLHGSEESPIVFKLEDKYQMIAIKNIICKGLEFNEDRTEGKTLCSFVTTDSYHGYIEVDFWMGDMKQARYELNTIYKIPNKHMNEHLESAAINDYLFVKSKVGDNNLELLVFQKTSGDLWAALELDYETKIDFFGHFNDKNESYLICYDYTHKTLSTYMVTNAEIFVKDEKEFLKLNNIDLAFTDLKNSEIEFKLPIKILSIDLNDQKGKRKAGIIVLCVCSITFVLFFISMKYFLKFSKKRKSNFKLAKELVIFNFI